MRVPNVPPITWRGKRRRTNDSGPQPQPTLRVHPHPGGPGCATSVPLVTFRSETGARRAVSPIARNGKLGDGAWRLQRAEARQRAHPAVIVAGSWSQVRPSTSRPPAFGLGPPTCLKKTGTCWSTHRMSRTQARSGIRYRGPPPGALDVLVTLLLAPGAVPLLGGGRSPAWVAAGPGPGRRGRRTRRRPGRSFAAVPGLPREWARVQAGHGRRGSWRRTLRGQ
jgi:hypothetical protein